VGVNYEYFLCYNKIKSGKLNTDNCALKLLKRSGKIGGGEEIKISSTRRGLCQNRGKVKDENLDIPFLKFLTCQN